MKFNKEKVIFCIFLVYIIFGFKWNPNSPKRIKIYGMIEYKSGQYINVTETTVQEWMYFLTENNFDKKFYPDEEVIANLPFNELFFPTTATVLKKSNYHYPKFIFPVPEYYFENREKRREINSALELPIVGITKNQVEEYCIWKTKKMEKLYPNLFLLNKKIVIKLPEESLYRDLLQNGDSITWRKNGTFCASFNYKNWKCNSLKGVPLNNELLSSARFLPDENGLFDIRGNALEMLGDKEEAIGGSFEDYAQNVLKKRSIISSKGTEYLGFRCYGELIEN